MPADLSDAFKKAGYKGASNETKCRQCGKSFTPRDSRHTLCPDCFKQQAQGPRERTQEAVWSFPEGYPDYFDEDGILRPEYVTTLADDIAQQLGRTFPKMTMHQLRAFYQHAKLQEGALEKGRPFKEVLVQVCKLKAFAEERASKGKIPRVFEVFISRNVDKVKDDVSFRKGFIEHFQAVVAYCAGTIREG